MKKSPGAFLVLCMGLALTGLAVFANRIGVDPTPTWGPGRITLLTVGLIISILAGTYYQFSRRLQGEKFFGWLNTSLEHLLPTFCILVVLVIYIWFISVGRWTVWPKGAINYYSQLAESFQEGHLYLDIQPDPALLALPNPYEFEALTRTHSPIDVSLYHGKFYLYWGPVPALLLAVLKTLISRELADQHLTFIFVAGTFIFHGLILRFIRRRFFPDVPGAAMSAGLLLAGLIGPGTWMLNDPITYEVAVASGQFWFIGGLYFALLGLKDQRARFLALTGLFFALATGSRPTQLLPACFMLLMIIANIVKAQSSRSITRAAHTCAALLLPFVAGLLGLAWYNWARFGSAFEFGLLYQLGGGGPDFKGRIAFLPEYLPQNLYNYLLNPFQVRPIFPFLRPLEGRKTSIWPSLQLPPTYQAEEKITGLLQSAPFLAFGFIILLVLSILAARKMGASKSSGMERDGISLDWIWQSLFGAFLAGFLPLLLYFWPAMRYAADFFSPLCLLAIIGFWQIHSWLKSVPVAREAILAVGMGLGLYSITVNTVLAFTYKLIRFSTLNPALLEKLKNLLGG